VCKLETIGKERLPSMHCFKACDDELPIKRLESIYFLLELMQNISERLKKQLNGAGIELSSQLNPYKSDI